MSTVETPRDGTLTSGAMRRLAEPDRAALIEWANTFTDAADCISLTLVDGVVSYEAFGTPRFVAGVQQKLEGCAPLGTPPPPVGPWNMAVQDSDVVRLREAIGTVVGLLQNEHGGQLSVCVEPDGGDGAYEHPSGFRFDLGQPFTDEFWDELVAISEECV